MRAGSSRDSEDDEDVVPTTSTSDALTSTNSEASVGRSVCSKAQKRNSTKPGSATRRSGSRNILGCTAMILSRACSASSARSEEMHRLQPGVHGLLGEFRIGITLLNNSASQNVTEMLLSVLEWQNKERSRVSYNCNVQQLLRRLKKGEQRTET